MKKISYGFNKIEPKQYWFLDAIPGSVKLSLINDKCSGVLQVPPHHDGLEDGGEGRDPDAGADQHRVLGVEDLTGWSSERSINEDLQ